MTAGVSPSSHEPSGLLHGMATKEASAGDVALPAMQICGGERGLGRAATCADPGVPRMTTEVLRECCLNNNGYETPECNDVLILHYKGFRRIENLEAYAHVKSLFLESNGIMRIENLETLSGIVSLYLQSNCISQIENLERLTSLQYLNLSHNSISRVENLALLKSLETLNLAANKIVDVHGLRGIAERPTLKSVDVSCNYIEDGDGLIEFWADALPKVECLYLHHNSCSRGLKDYRRRMVSTLPHLRWLDDRPVNASERVGCEAWAIGGKEAELKAKQDHFWQLKEDKEKSFRTFRRLQEATADRARLQQEHRAERDRLRAQESDKLKQVGGGSLAEGWCAASAFVEAPPAKLSQTSTGERGAAEMIQEKSPTEGIDRPVAFVPGDCDGIDGEGLQSALRAKVQAFLDSRRTDQGIGQDDEPTDRRPGERRPGEDGAVDLVVDRCPHFSHESGQPSLERGAGTEAASWPTSPVAAEAAEVPLFAWNAFRDRRLGHLAKDHKLNFGKVAEALVEEFGSVVDSDECRRRYREILRPSSSKGGSSNSEGGTRHLLNAAAGRARDGPPAEPATVQDFSDWWVRKFQTKRTATFTASTVEALDVFAAPAASVASNSTSTALVSSGGESSQVAASQPVASPPEASPQVSPLFSAPSTAASPPAAPLSASMESRIAFPVSSGNAERSSLEAESRPNCGEPSGYEAVTLAPPAPRKTQPTELLELD